MSAGDLLPGRFAHLGLDEFARERIRWTGHPDFRQVFLRASPIWLFAIPWKAFALFWETMAAAH